MEDFNPFALTGKQILVTGASSGIGRAIAIACAKMGATVFITGRNKDGLNETLKSLPEGSHQMWIADLTIADDICKLTDALPKLDGLVQCAGIGSRMRCKMITKEDIAHVMQPNMEAPILLQTEILKKKKLKKGASVVYIASRAYQYPSMGNAIYSASKGAIVAYAKCLALELAQRQIRVNCICPGMVWTNLITNDGLTKEELEEAQLKYPLKRFGNVEDVANLTIYLLSDASTWMTGSCVDISGGGEGVLV